MIVAHPRLKPWSMISRPLRGGNPSRTAHLVALSPRIDPDSQKQNAAAAAQGTACRAPTFLLRQFWRIVFRNSLVRGCLGLEKMTSGESSSRIFSLLEKQHPVRDLLRKAHVVGDDYHRHVALTCEIA